MKKNIANFTAGPSLLPAEIEQGLRAATRDFLGTGVSIWSISDRQPLVEDIVQATADLLRKVLSVPKSHAVAFVPGGASSQFTAWILNMTRWPGKEDTRRPKIGYVDSGYGSRKAFEAGECLQAAGLCSVGIVASSKREDYRTAPCVAHVPKDVADFVHMTSNETANGTQLRLDGFAVSEYCNYRRTYPIIADMSSDIFSRRFNVDDFEYIYAGAQKNAGVAGATIVIVRETLIEGKTGSLVLPSPLCVENQVGAQSGLYNTPDLLAIYSIYLTLRWIVNSGGIEEMERRSINRADALYCAIDTSDLFEGIVSPESRSLMNVTFRLRDASMHESFLKLCTDAGIVGIDGHEGVVPLYGPHCRASLYNAQTIKNVRRLIDVMREFERRS